jgi:SanA protein
MRKFLFACLIFGVVIILGIVLIHRYIQSTSKPYIFSTSDKIPGKYVALVLGAYVGNDGTPSTVLADRLNAALELYWKGKVKRFLLTGDHGHQDYDEVNNMKRYLKEHGVPESDIFLDHAGFDTYNSMVRAREIFQIREMIIVTQEFHLSRALYIARRKGIDAVGFPAEMSNKSSLKSLEVREGLANLKAFWEVLINKKPKFLGSKIPITGDSKLSYD